MRPSRIRSFVRREGRVTVRQRHALEHYWDNYVISPEQCQSLIADPHRKPITLEIGFGMGHSLVELASQQPQRHFIGVEVHRPGVGALLAAATELQLSNINVICGDVVEALPSIPAESLERILVFFPDPWHKKRHHKRRLIQIDFVEQLKQRLARGGILHLATDWLPYGEHMMEVMSQINGFTRLADDADPRPQTKFERRGLRLGHGVTDLVFQKN